MNRVSQTNQAMWVMEQLPTAEARLEYQRTLPKGIGARVLSRILDKAQVERYTERLHQQAMEGLARMAEAEKKPYDPWAPHYA